MSIKVGINGFGLVGHNVLRAILESGRTDTEVVAINDLTPIDNSTYLFKYDSTHGIFPRDVSYSENAMIIDGKSINISAHKDPNQLN